MDETLQIPQNPRTLQILLDAERAQKMLLAYTEEHKTLNQISKEFNLTRERVRQIISQFPYYFEYRDFHGTNVEHPAKKAECLFCKKIITIINKYTKYCSRECQIKYTLHKHATIQEKKCNKCGNIKQASEFFRQKKKYGTYLASMCKKCHGKVVVNWKKNNYERNLEITKRAVIAFQQRHSIDCSMCGKRIWNYKKKKTTFCRECYYENR